jgi:oligoendopeptidase F
MGRFFETVFEKGNLFVNQNIEDETILNFSLSNIVISFNVINPKPQSKESKVKRLNGTVSFLLTGIFLFLSFSALFAQTSTRGIPQRAEISEKYKWKLEDIYSTNELWEADFARLKSSIPQFSDFKSKLGESAKTLLDCLQLQDNLGIILGRLWVYAYMRLDEDTRVSLYQAMTDRISNLNTEFNQTTSFIQPEILTLSEEKLKNFVKENKGLSLYQHYFDNLMRTKAHILPEEQEELLALVGNLARAPQKIFTMLDDADIKYPSIKDENGVEVQLTKERYSKFLESADRRVRREANDAYNSAYLNYINTLAANLSAGVSKDIFFAKARKYNSSLEMALDADSIPMSVYDNLVKTVDANLTPLHRYCSLRKKFMKLDTLYTFDLWVPLVPKAKMEIPYDEAVQTITEALSPLGGKYVSDLKMGFNSGWVDVYETEGKGSGAYSWGAYTTHPYMLLNYNNTLENMFAIAHEMGHCLNRYYTYKKQPYVYSDNPLFVAEVASTCNEALMIDYLVNHTKDKDKKAYFLEYYIQQILGTFYVQAMLSEFEKNIHEQMESGQGLTAESMRQIYRNILQKFYGPEVVIGPTNDLGWARISHFYRDFYVFQYSTSYAASTALARKIIEGRKDDVERYLSFLEQGNSDYPVSLLKKAGVDMASPEPIERITELFDSLVSQLEKLLLE